MGGRANFSRTFRGLSRSAKGASKNPLFAVIPATAGGFLQLRKLVIQVAVA